MLTLGFRAGKHRVARLMQEMGLQGCPKKPYKVTTRSDHGFRVAPNSLDRSFTAEQPNQRWAADITYIRTAEGWLYLAVVMGLYSKAIVGWSMSHRITRDIVLKALLMAIAARRPTSGLLHHSDRGSRYASGDFQDLLDEHGIECNFGHCGNHRGTNAFFCRLRLVRIPSAIMPAPNSPRLDGSGTGVGSPDHVVTVTSSVHSASGRLD